MNNKTKIYLHYIYDKNSKELLSLPVVQCMYDYFSKQEDFEVVDTTDDVDVFFFFAGGPTIISEKHLRRIQFLEKWGRYFPSLLAKRYMLPNLTAEAVLADARRKNPKMKIVHRLDDRYLYLCKLYGSEQTILNVNRLADVTIYQSKYCQTLYEEHKSSIFGPLPTIACRNTRFIYNGVDTNIFRPDGEKVDLPGKIRICHASATGMPRKGLAMVLTIAELLKNNPDIHFYLLGRQDLDPLSGHFVRRLKNVTHVPYVKSREEMAKYLRSMTLLLFPSIDDCSPNTVIEAMASGLPVLAERSGGTPEMLEKEDGLLGGLFLEHANPIHNLKVILENHSQFSANALEIVRKYHSSTIMCENYKDMIHSLSR